jgi:3'(2'), 5'-bisphosphate nucleotidase
MGFSLLIPNLLNVANHAGNAILRIYNRKMDFQIESKADNSPVTLADRASHDILLHGLRSIQPMYPVISEEGLIEKWETRKEWEYCWLVDPLDGTREFIKRNYEFCINIALIEKGKPVVGLIHAPCTGYSYFAVRNEGAYSIFNGKKQVLLSASFRESDSNLTLLCSRSHHNYNTSTFLARYKEPVLHSMGSALKFILIATGSAHLYPKLGPTYEWDTAAAQIILEEAGGHLVDLKTREPLVYNKPDLVNPNFLATGNIISP